MYLCVRTYGPQATDQMLHEGRAAQSLAICVAMGVVTYVAGVAFLWLLSGRPVGAETWAANLIRGSIARLRPPA
jgi:hypothetical protein